MKRTLQAIIREFGDSQTSLAKYLGISESTMSWKINGKSNFTQSELQLIRDRYNLSPDEFCEVFFD